MVTRSELVAGVALALVALLAAGASAARGTSSLEMPFKLSPIAADFVPEKFRTEYSVDARATIRGYELKLTDTWTITFALVDPAGAPAPGVPGSGAAVDIGCSNHGAGLTNHPYIDTMDRDRLYLPYQTDNEFLWHHGDQDGCNHMDMGPHGHQGLVTVVVSGDGWECSETYKGTNTTTQKNLTNGTASQPKCRKTA